MTTTHDPTYHDSSRFTSHFPSLVILCMFQSPRNHRYKQQKP